MDPGTASPLLEPGFRFSHFLVCEALRGRAASLAGLHLRAAEALIEMGAPASEIAHHLAAADLPRDDTRPIEYLLRAAEDANRALAFDAAVEMLEGQSHTRIRKRWSAGSTLGDVDSALNARVQARLAAARAPAPNPLGPIRLQRDAIAMARRLDDPRVLLDVIHSGMGGMATPRTARATHSRGCLRCRRTFIR